MKVLIADDEPLARARLKRLLQQFEGFNVVEEAIDGLDALEKIETSRADLVLLDIEMPRLTGLELASRLKALNPPPAIVFITAYPEHALDAFSVQATGYLVKPVSLESLSEVLKRVGVITRAQLAGETVDEPYISIQIGSRLERIPLHDVFFFKAEDKVVLMHHSAGEAIVDMSLSQLENKYHHCLFRTHRSYLVNITKVRSLKTNRVGQHFVNFNSSNQVALISRRHLKAFKEKIRD